MKKMLTEQVLTAWRRSYIDSTTEYNYVMHDTDTNQFGIMHMDLNILNTEPFPRAVVKVRGYEECNDIQDAFEKLKSQESRFCKDFDGLWIQSARRNVVDQFAGDMNTFFAKYAVALENWADPANGDLVGRGQFGGWSTELYQNKHFVLDVLEHVQCSDLDSYVVSEIGEQVVPTMMKDALFAEDAIEEDPYTIRYLADHADNLEIQDIINGLSEGETKCYDAYVEKGAVAFRRAVDEYCVKKLDDRRSQTSRQTRGLQAEAAFSEVLDAEDTMSEEKSVV